jgi:hypothetical protein
MKTRLLFLSLLFRMAIFGQEPDFANLQGPATITLESGQTAMVFAQAFEEGITESAGAGEGINAWIGISNENTDPSTWTTWIPAPFSTQEDDNDEYAAEIGSALSAGTYYYTSRFALAGGDYVYGGYSATGGGFWDGINNVSGILTVSCSTPPPTVPDDGPIFCNFATIADLEADGDMILWYDTETGGEALAEDTPLIDSVTYYAAQVIDGCESTERTTVYAYINAPQAPWGDAVQGFCYIGTVGDLVSDNGSVWYDAPAGGNMLSGDTPLVNLETYYIAQVFDGCEGIPRLAVQAILYTTVVDTLPDVTSCSGYTLPTLEYGNYFLDMGGEGTMLTAGTVITETTAIYIYNEDGTNPVCSNESSFTVTINPMETPDVEAVQTITVENTAEATLEDLDANLPAGATVAWYLSEEDALAGENALSAGTLLSSGTTYYGIQSLGGCTSSVFAVTADIVLGTDNFDAGSFSYHPNPVKNMLAFSYTGTIDTIKVYNMIGQQVMMQQVGQNEGQLDMATLAAGAYLVKVTAGEASKTIKIIKQ